MYLGQIKPGHSVFLGQTRGIAPCTPYLEFTTIFYHTRLACLNFYSIFMYSRQTFLSADVRTRHVMNESSPSGQISYCKQGSIQRGGGGGGGGKGEASPPPPPNVACCVQCLYSTTTIISSAKISSDVIVCSKKNRPHGTCHGEVLEAQE